MCHIRLNLLETFRIGELNLSNTVLFLYAHTNRHLLPQDWVIHIYLLFTLFVVVQETTKCVQSLGVLTGLFVMVVLSRIHKASLLLLLLLRETTRRFLELLECLAICHFKCFDESLTFDNVIANRRNLSFLFLLSIYNWIILLSKINLFSLLDKSFIKVL